MGNILDQYDSEFNALDSDPAGVLDQYDDKLLSLGVSTSDSVFDIDSGKTINVDYNENVDQKLYYDDIGNGANPSNYFGYVKTALGEAQELLSAPKRGIQVTASSIVATASESIRRQYADAYRDALDGKLDDYSILKRLNPFGLVAGAGRNKGVIDRRFLNQEQQESAILANEDMLIAAENIKYKHQAWLESTGVAETDDIAEKLVFDVFGGITTLVGSLGVAALTRSPAASLALIGGIQKNQSYVEARDKGWSPQAADSISSVMGAVEGGLEMVGIGKMLDVLQADKFVSSMVKTMLIEGAQEFAQSAGESTVAQVSGLRDTDVSGAFKDALYSGLVGMLSGAPVSAINTYFKDEGFGERQAKRLSEGLFKNKEQVEERVAEIVNNEAEIFDPNDPVIKKVGDMFDRFQKGDEIDIRAELNALTEINDAQKQEVIDFIEKKTAGSVEKAGLVAAKGRVKVIEKQINFIDNQIIEAEKRLNKKNITEGEKAAAIERMDNLYDKRLELSDKAYSFLDEKGNVGATDAVKSELRKQTLTQGSSIVALGGKVSSEAVSAVRVGLSKGRQLAIKDAKGARDVIIQTIEDSGLPNKGKFLKMVSDIGKSDITYKAINRIVSRVNREIDVAQRKEIKELIVKTLSMGKQKQAGKKPVGVLGDARIQSQVGALLSETKDGRSKITEKDPEKRAEILAKRKKAREKKRDVAAKQLHANLESGKTDAVTKFENMLLAIRSGYQDMSVSDMAGVLLQINSVVKGGKKLAEVKKFTRDEHIHEVRSRLMDQLLKGREVEDLDNKTISEKIIDGMTAARSRFWGMQYSWKQFIDIPFGKDKELSDGLFEMMFQAEQIKRRLLVKHGKAFTDTYMDIYNLSSNEIRAAITKDDVVIDTIGVFKKNGDTRARPWSMSRSEARKLWMELRDPTLSDTLFAPIKRQRDGDVEVKTGNGLTDEMIDALDSYLTPKDKRFIDAQIELYQDIYVDVNAVYSDMYGVDLPFNEFYSPIKRSRHTDIESYDEFLSEKHYRASASSQTLLKDRVDTIVQIAAQSDTSVFTRYISHSAQFVSFAQPTRDLRAYFTGTDISDVIESKLGKQYNANLMAYIDDFSRGSAKRDEWTNSIFQNLNNNMATSVIGLKPNMTAKQLTSFIAYADEIPSGEFAKGLADFAKNPQEAIKILSSTDYMILRGADPSLDIIKGSEASLLEKSLGYGQNINWKQAQLIFTKLGDRSAIYMGGWAVYKYNRDVLKKSHEESVEAFVRATDSSQQSASISQRSRWQMSTNPFVRTFVAFKSAPLSYFKKEIDAIRDFSRGDISRKEFAKKIAIYHFILPVMFQYVGNALVPDDEDDSSLWRAAVLGSLNGPILIGDILTTGFARLYGTYYEGKGMNYLMGIEDLSWVIADTARNWEDGIEFTEILEALAVVGGTLTGYATGAAINATKGVLGDMPEGDIVKGALRFGGYTEKKAERASDYFN